MRADTLNLALGGLSALDGLEIIQEQGLTPDLVMIEANVLFRPANADFQSRLLSPLMFRLRSIFWAVRDVSRPIPILISYTHSALRRIAATFRQAPTMPDHSSKAGEAQKRGSILERMLTSQKSAFEMPLRPDETLAISHTLDRQLSSLKQRGVQLAFFEMPTHPTLCELPRQEMMREFLKERYAQVQYIRIRTCDGIKTSDGLHLTAEEGSQATRLLVEQLEIHQRDSVQNW